MEELKEKLREELLSNDFVYDCYLGKKEELLGSFSPENWKDNPELQAEFWAEAYSSLRNLILDHIQVFHNYNEAYRYYHPIVPKQELEWYVADRIKE